MVLHYLLSIHPCTLSFWPNLYRSTLIGQSIGLTLFVNLSLIKSHTFPYFLKHDTPTSSPTCISCIHSLQMEPASIPVRQAQTPQCHKFPLLTDTDSPVKKVQAGEVTKSAHPARFSPDDKYSRYALTCKICSQAIIVLRNELGVVEADGVGLVGTGSR